MKVAWPSGLRRWFKAPVSSEAWVQIPPLPRLLFRTLNNQQKFYFFYSENGSWNEAEEVEKVY